MFKVGDKVRLTCSCHKDDIGRVLKLAEYGTFDVALENGDSVYCCSQAELIPEVSRKEDIAAPIETIVTDPKTGGQKGQKLAQMGALDPRALLAVGEVGGFGAKKYARYNFMKGYAWSLSYDALQRHLHAFWGGQNRDEESGLYHLAHAAWHCLALLTFVIRGLGTDDRPPQ